MVGWCRAPFSDPMFSRLGDLLSVAPPLDPAHRDESNDVHFDPQTQQNNGYNDKNSKFC